MQINNGKPPPPMLSAPKTELRFLYACLQGHKEYRGWLRLIKSEPRSHCIVFFSPKETYFRVLFSCHTRLFVFVTSRSKCGFLFQNGWAKNKSTAQLIHQRERLLGFSTFWAEGIATAPFMFFSGHEAPIFKTKYVNCSTAETSQVYKNTIFPVVKYLYLSCSPPPLLSFSIWRVVECPSTWISYIRGNLISHFDPTLIASLMYSMTSTWNNFAFVMFAMDALSRLRLYYSIVM